MEAELDEGFLQEEERGQSQLCSRGVTLVKGFEQGPPYLLVYVQFSEDLSGVKEVIVVQDPGATVSIVLVSVLCRRSSFRTSLH